MENQINKITIRKGIANSSSGRIYRHTERYVEMSRHNKNNQKSKMNLKAIGIATNCTAKKLTSFKWTILTRIFSTIWGLLIQIEKKFSLFRYHKLLRNLQS